jgi:hypothetical protein
MVRCTTPLFKSMTLTIMPSTWAANTRDPSGEIASPPMKLCGTGSGRFDPCRGIGIGRPTTRSSPRVSDLALNGGRCSPFSSGGGTTRRTSHRSSCTVLLPAPET